MENFIINEKPDLDETDYDDIDPDALYPICLYSSGSESENISPPKKTHISHKWVFETIFTNEADAEAFIASEDTWGSPRRSNTHEGIKVVYRCNKLKREGPQCSAKIYLMFHWFHMLTSCIVLYRTKAKHDHDSLITNLAITGGASPANGRPKKWKQRTLFDILKKKPSKLGSTDAHPGDNTR